MFRQALNTIFKLTAFLVMVSCAKTVSLGGGPIDETPPKLVRSVPENLEVNYSKNKIYLAFDEFVTFNNFNKEFIMTPKPEKVKVKPPSGYASKKFVVEFEPVPGVNTYKMDFGKVVQDYKEGNVLEGLTLTFSLGTTADSGKIKGSILADTTEVQQDKLMAVLYLPKEKGKFKEKLITQKQAPYSARVNPDSLFFVFDYLPESQYKLMVFEDLNDNKLYDPKKEHIGFLGSPTLPDTSTVHRIPLFKEFYTPVFTTPEQSKGKIRLIYNHIDFGDSLEIKLLNEVIGPYKISKITDEEESKTYLDIWHKTHLKEKTKFKFTDVFKDTVSINLEKDSLETFPQAEYSLSSTEAIHPTQKLFIQSKTVPIKSFNQSKIILTKIGSSSSTVKGKYSLSDDNIQINFKRRGGTSYQAQLNPNAITDFFGNKNADTLRFEFNTLDLSKQTGDLELQLEQTLKKPLIVQLVSDELSFKKELKKGETQLSFENLPGKTYKLTLLVDENNNKLWDNGDFFNQKQPEIKYNLNLTIEIGETKTVEISGASITELSIKLKSEE
jgi:hypothetical protein